jgi:subtilisin family serine protease
MDATSRLFGVLVAVGLLVAAPASTSAADGRPLARVASAGTFARIDDTPSDPIFENPYSWAFTLPGFPAAWDAANGLGEPVTVAVVDTGVNPVADLAGALVPGWNFVAGNDDTADDNGHGTEVAGTIAARGDNGIGSAGACWRCLIMPIKVADANGVGADDNVAAGIRYAVDHGARVVNLSLGQSEDAQVLADAVSYAEAHGVLVVAAAGNAGGTAPSYPADYPGVLSVAASDGNDARFGWSNYGSWVGVAAAGCVVTTTSNGGYGTACGTSFATPMTAGLAALILSVRPQATADQIEQAIDRTAVAVAGGYVAYGRIDAEAALASFGVVAATDSLVDAPRRLAVRAS